LRRECQKDSNLSRTMGWEEPNSVHSRSRGILGSAQHEFNSDPWIWRLALQAPTVTLHRDFDQCVIFCAYSQYI
jgi:hypothetical protein